MTKLVSIVIPVFNAAGFLAEAIGSALAQTYADIEVIVVDDGSTDGTPTVLESFATQVKTVRQNNAGVSAARNRATELARGAFIQYLDADDLLAPEAVEDRVESLESSGEDVAYSDWDRVEEDSFGTVISCQVISNRMEDVSPDPEIAAFTLFWAPPAALLYRREIVNRIGGWNESLPIIQDARFILDAAMCGARFIHVPGPGAKYRVRLGEGLSRTSTERFARDVYTNALQVEAVWRERGALTPDRRRAVYQVLDYTARALFECDYALFQDNLRWLYKLEPRFRASWPKAAGALARLLGVRTTSKVLSLIGKPPPVVVDRAGRPCT